MLICDLGQAKNLKVAENYLDYLIRIKKLGKLKKEGRVITAQATTSERSQINVEQKLRWHYLIEAEWEYLRKVNTLT